MRSTVPHCSSSSNIACFHLTYLYPLDAANCVSNSVALVPTVVITRLCAVGEHGRLLTDVVSCANYCLWRWIVRTHGHRLRREEIFRTYADHVFFNNRGMYLQNDCTAVEYWTTPTDNAYHDGWLAGWVVSMHTLNRLKPSGFSTYHEV
jgi:hypothetical protein